MTPTSTPNAPIHIEHAIRGPADAPAFLLIRGLSTQLIQWPDAFLDGLVEEGFRAVVFDNRDCGLSTKFDVAGVPAMADLLEGRASSPYSVADMAADAVSVLDALGIERAHVAGMSLGGMIAQHLALSHGDRCLSVTSIMSTSGAPGLPSGTPEAMASLSATPEDPADRESVIRHLMRHQGVIGSPAYPQTPEEARRYCEHAYDRCYCPEGTARQMAAVLTDTGRAERLAEIRVPFQVIHGTDDPLIPIECGRDTARRVPNARFVEIPGMGHDVTIASTPHLLAPLVAFAREHG